MTDKPLTNFDNPNIPHGYVLIDGKIVLDELNKSLQRSIRRAKSKPKEPAVGGK